MTASTTPQSGYGAAITWYGHDIGYMTSIGGIGMDAEIMSYKTHDSKYIQKIGGHVDAGQITIGVKFITGDTTGQAYFLDDVKTGTEREVIITFPDATTWTVNAIAKSLSMEVPPDDTIDATLVIECTGSPTFSEE